MEFLLVSFLAGIASTIDPCCLPSLPIVFSMTADKKNRTRPLSVILGLLSSFLIISALFLMLELSFNLSPDIRRFFAGVVITIFGLILLFPHVKEYAHSYTHPFLDKISKNRKKSPIGLMKGYFLGSIIGVIWALCALPLLGSVLTLASSKQYMHQGEALLLAFILGLLIPTMLIAYGGKAISSKMQSFTTYSIPLQRIFGVLLIISSFLLLTGFDTFIDSLIRDQLSWVYMNVKAYL